MTLDSVRAAFNHDELDLYRNSKVTGYVYSSGALNMGWTSSLKPLHAHELTVVECRKHSCLWTLVR